MGDGSEVGVKVMGYPAVGHCSASASVGVYTHILVGSVRKRGVGPSVLVICRQLLVDIFGICIGGIQTQRRTQWSYLRELHHQFRSGPLDVGSIILHCGFCKGPVCHLHFHRGPVFIFCSAHIHHTCLAVNLDLRIVRHHETFRPLQDVI